jgi:hypothetical protein
MKLLPNPKCPLCGAALPIVEVWRRASTGRGMQLRAHTGIWCPACGGRLAVLQGRAVLVGTIGLIFGAACGATLLIQIEERTWHKLSAVEELALLAPILVLFLWWHSRAVPRFCRFRIAPNSEVLNFPISLEKSQKR